MPATKLKSKTPSDTELNLIANKPQANVGTDAVVNMDVLTQYSNEDDKASRDNDSSFVKIDRVVTAEDNNRTIDYICKDDSK